MITNKVYSIKESQNHGSFGSRIENARHGLAADWFVPDWMMMTLFGKCPMKIYWGEFIVQVERGQKRLNDGTSTSDEVKILRSKILRFFICP